MPLLMPLLVEMGVNASMVAGAVLAARIAIFAYRFTRKGL